MNDDINIATLPNAAMLREIEHKGAEPLTIGSYQCPLPNQLALWCDTPKTATVVGKTREAESSRLRSSVRGVLKDNDSPTLTSGISSKSRKKWSSNVRNLAPVKARQSKEMSEGLLLLPATSVIRIVGCARSEGMVYYMPVPLANRHNLQSICTLLAQNLPWSGFIVGGPYPRWRSTCSKLSLPEVNDFQLVRVDPTLVQTEPLSTVNAFLVSPLAGSFSLCFYHPEPRGNDFYHVAKIVQCVSACLGDVATE